MSRSVEGSDAGADVELLVEFNRLADESNRRIREDHGPRTDAGALQGDRPPRHGPPARIEPHQLDGTVDARDGDEEGTVGAWCHLDAEPHF